ncbi:hypothetical protein [Aeromicrobium sp.]|uniref:hypothetical protein n=1 Tax=Aeromicrobium sp. TaxID=1871063 RepID=UPI001996E9B2|nr:hypothetical protein [Aeromicrobium sp.]MBC7631375.1 hypothetical protein [Aeromicrobium sp.]
MLTLATSTGEAPWWGVPLIGGLFAIFVLVLGAINERVRERTRRRIERDIRWDERRLDLFVRVTTYLRDAKDSLVALSLDSTTAADKGRHRTTVAAAFRDLRPLVRELSLLQLDRVYMDVEQAHSMLLLAMGDAETPLLPQQVLDDFRLRLYSAEQGMRIALGTPHVKGAEFKSPRVIVQGAWNRVTDPLRRDWMDDNRGGVL